MNKIRKFIENNNMTFTEGERNSNIVTLIGYSLHENISEENLKNELKPEIEEDSFIKDEIERLYNYCKINNYADFWSTPEAKNMYKF